MRTSQQWKTILIILLFIGLLAFPIVLVVIRKPEIFTFLPSRTHQTTARYSTESTLPGYTLMLADTGYLDYATGIMRTFTPKTMVDPQVYVSKSKSSARYSVSKARFVLVGKVSNPVSFITEKDGTILATGGYTIEGDTLVVRISVMFDKLSGSVLSRKFNTEDVVLRAVINTLYYAHGEESPMATVAALGKMRQDIQDNLYSGIMAWPFRISEKTK